jgi:hypothetical protein
LFVCGKITFFYTEKDQTLIYRKITSFVMSFAYMVSQGRRQATTSFPCLLRGIVVGKEMFFNLIIKLWLRFMSHHLVLWLLGTLWSARVWVRDWLCKGKMHHSQCTLPKINYIVVWLFFYVEFLFIDLV